MLIDTFRHLLVSQFEASLCTIAHCVEKCPDAVWNMPVVKYPFCQVAFHALFYADFYLGTGAEAMFRQPFHLANPEFFDDYEQLLDRGPRSLYEKPAIIAYLEFCRGKVAATIAAETEETLSAPTTFARRSWSRAEMHIYNIRHIQHHAAQLIMRLRLDTDIDIPWIGNGWTPPAPA